MKIKLGLSANLARDEIWQKIWAEFVRMRTDYPLEFVPIGSDIEPCFIIDSNEAPFTIFLDEIGINLNNFKIFIETGLKKGRLEFVFISAVLSSLLRYFEQMVLKKVVYANGVMPEDVEDELQNETAKQLAMVNVKRVPVLGEARIIRETDQSLVIICKNADVAKKLGSFFVKMQDRGWRFESITLSS